jgi:hypothetical protein
VPTFANRGFRVVSATDPPVVNSGFLTVGDTSTELKYRWLKFRLVVLSIIFLFLYKKVGNKITLKHTKLAQRLQDMKKKSDTFLMGKLRSSQKCKTKCSTKDTKEESKPQINCNMSYSNIT